MTTTRQVAQLAQCAEQTVRNHTRTYAEFFTLDARGEHGPRLFSEADVQTFLTIVQLRNEGVPVQEVRARLRRGDVLIDATTTPHQATPNAPDGPHDAQLWLLVQRDLERQMDALRHAQRVEARRALWTHGVAFYLGMVTMGVVFFVVWWIVNL